MGGGCCSSNYACGTESCTATTLDPQSVTCGGIVGYYGCPLSVGGGCCPVGLICSPDDCVPPAGQSITDTSCPSKYTLCPESVGYGCCMSGLLCGTKACYRTIESFTTTLTTVDASGETTTLTATTSTTVSPNFTIMPSATEGQAGFKYFPTSVPKQDAISSSSSGLPKKTLGGLVGGGVALLIIIIAATIFIHRRLRHTEKVAQSSKKSSSKGRTGNDGTTVYTITKDENGSSISANGNGTSRRPSHGRTTSQSSEGVGYTEFGQPSSSTWGGYNAIPTSASEGGIRPSVDSASPGSYFDQRVSQQSAPHRYSVDSNDRSATGTPYGHGRQWSVSTTQGEPYTTVPQELDSQHITPELPGSLGASPLNSPGLAPTADNRRRSSSLGPKPPLSHNNPRRRSDSHQRGRSDSSSTGAAPQLGVLSENPEMHGFYGPADRQVGQTAAGLQSGDVSPTPGGSARTSFSVQR